MSNTGQTPIYEQIYEQIKAHIIAGQLAEGDLLPSIRVLAKELRISVITTKRAYDELEHGGFVVSISGKGSYVAGKNVELIREENLKQIEKHLQEVMTLAAQCGLSGNDLKAMLDLLYEGE